MTIIIQVKLGFLQRLQRLEMHRELKKSLDKVIAIGEKKQGRLEDLIKKIEITKKIGLI